MLSQRDASGIHLSRARPIGTQINQGDFCGKFQELWEPGCHWRESGDCVEERDREEPHLAGHAFMDLPFKPSTL